MRIATKRIGPKELKTLELTIKHCIALQELLKEHELELSFNENTIQQVALTIQSNLKEEVPAVAAKGGMIASGINERLDAYRALAYESESALDKMLQEQIKQTGISSMKIASNSVFGYYFEVRNTHKDKVPESLHPQTNLGQC
jgi:DNA mismatch repair protein MutS